MPDFKTEECEFWMIWTKTGHGPRRVHATEQVALAEAQRLAAANPGKKFIVMRAFAKISAAPAVEAKAA